MFSQKLTKQKQLPANNDQRVCTDVCCTLIGSVFALVMFVFALLLMNKGNYLKTNYPIDSDNIPCSYGPNSIYSYLYFPNVNDISKRVCVSQCPQKDDIQLTCRPNKAIPHCDDAQIYDTKPNYERIGGVCGPTALQQQKILIRNTKLTQKYNFLNYYDSIRLSLIFALLIGIIWMVLIQCFPKALIFIAPILAILILLCSGILLLCDDNDGWSGKSGWRIFIGIMLIIFSICMSIFYLMNRKLLHLTGVLIKSSGQFISRRCIVTLNIPIFILLTIGLIVLCLFQHIVYSNYYQPIAHQNQIFLQSQPIMILFVLNIIQFIWGLQFLKDSFNFMVSGQSSQWYALKGKNDSCSNPIFRYFKFNFGSVVGGSFLNGFFNLLGFAFQAIRCYPQGKCGKAANFCICWESHLNFLQLVRTDSYSYINLTGIPYCNAAKNCQSICNQTTLFTGSQSALYFYRLSAKIFCVGFNTLLGYWVMKNKTGAVSVISLIIIILLSYCIINYFSDLHSDSAEGIQIGQLLDRQFEKMTPQCQKVFQQLKEGLNQVEKL